MPHSLFRGKYAGTSSLDGINDKIESADKARLTTAISIVSKIFVTAH